MEGKRTNKAKQLLPAPTLPSTPSVANAVQLWTAAVAVDLKMAKVAVHLRGNAVRTLG